MNSGGRRPREHEGWGTATACPRRAAAGRGLEGPRRRFGAAKSRLDDASTLERILRTAVTAKCVSATPGTLEGTRPRPRGVQGGTRYPGKEEVLECSGYPTRRSQVPWKGGAGCPGKAKYPGEQFPGTLEQKSQVPWSGNPKYPGRQSPSTLEGNPQVPWKGNPKPMYFIGKQNRGRRGHSRGVIEHRV
ncbi:hypothetical protein CDEST_10528 [Colletotrichum destructivum]|uniref:Uncharacterized protein n=1 Tax=Colletotrichum destructivum TaxID=34406 RepID=A0AAX4IPZ0_9PEZI|nr:hypothetical protein CDEST_10528 [Colletotrichum destructivum]